MVAAAALRRRCVWIFELSVGYFDAARTWWGASGLVGRLNGAPLHTWRQGASELVANLRLHDEEPPLVLIE